MNPQPLDGDRAALTVQVQRGGNWFHWIAGLSILYVVFALQSGHWNGGLFGLLAPEKIANYGTHERLLVKIFMGLICGGAASTFFLLGYFASRAARWAFVVGIVIYVCDTLLWALFAFLTPRNWMAVLFHGWALFTIVKGLIAANKLSTLNAAPPPMAYATHSTDVVWPPTPKAEPSPTLPWPTASSAPLAGPQSAAQTAPIGEPAPSAWPQSAAWPPSSEPANASSVPSGWPQASPMPPANAPATTGPDWNGGIDSRPRSKLYDEQSEG